MHGVTGGGQVVRVLAIVALLKRSDTHRVTHFFVERQVQAYRSMYKRAERCFKSRQSRTDVSCQMSKWSSQSPSGPFHRNSGFAFGQ
jgi:hypothetical protein